MGQGLLVEVRGFIGCRVWAWSVSNPALVLGVLLRALRAWG